jgi:WD40 repeat protein
MIRIYIILFHVFIFSASLIYSFEPEFKWKKQGETAKTNTFVFSKDGKYIYVQYKISIAGNDSIFIQKWNVEKKVVENEIPCGNEYNQMALSNDGNFLIGAKTYIQYLELINLNNNERKIISDIDAGGSFSAVRSISFSEDDNFIYVYHYNVKQIQIIDMKTLKRIDGINLKIMFSLVEFSIDGKYAGVTNGDSTFSIWNIADKNEIYKIKIHNQSFSICNIFLNHEYFVVNYYSSKNPDNIEIYSMKSGKLVTKTKNNFDYTYSIMLNDNKTILTSTFPSRNIEKFDINSKITTTINIPVSSSQMISSPTGDLLAAKDSSQFLFLYDITTEKPLMFLNKITENLSIFNKVIISHDKKYVYASGMKSADTLKRGKIIKYNFQTGDIIKIYPISDYFITDMVISKDGNIIAVVDTNGHIKIISNLSDSTAVIKSYNLKKIINVISISEDNTRLVAGGFMSGLFYINLQTDVIKSYFQDPYELTKFEPYIQSLSLNKKGDKLIVSGKAKKIWVLNYNQEIDEYVMFSDFKGDESNNPANQGVLHIAFSNDENYIYCSSNDGFSHIFDSKNFIEITKIKIIPDTLGNYPTTSYLSKDNKKIALGDIYKNIGIYDVNSGEQQWVKKSNNFHYYQINSISFSGDDEYMANTTNDGLLELYKIDDYTYINDASSNPYISIYPNPATDYIEIKLSEGYNIKIFDMLGEIVLTVEQTSSSVQRIDITKLTYGMYFLKIGNKIEKFLKM